MRFTRDRETRAVYAQIQLIRPFRSSSEKLPVMRVRIRFMVMAEKTTNMMVEKRVKSPVIMGIIRRCSVFIIGD
ncbi:predicted ORF [Xanthomonas phage XacN1]|nr:predicted ORF [Xanthomonas phage XacN1]BBA65615.1 predicted ORF [Xanthomonas phage XacN1]